MSQIDPTYDDDAFRKDKDEMIGRYWLDPNEYADVEDPRDNFRNVLIILVMTLLCAGVVGVGIWHISQK